MLENVRIEILLILLQIVTESLPISSSGHVLFFKELLGRRVESCIFEIFDGLAHGLTAVILVVFFWREWTSLVVRVLKIQWSRRSYRLLVSIVVRLVGYVFIVDFLTVLGYLLFRVYFKEAGFMVSNKTLFCGFVLTASGLLSLYFLRNRSLHGPVDGRKAIYLGLVQAVALLPGISRFASTYVVSRWLGISARRALQFSFLAFFPLILVTFGKNVIDLFKIPAFTGGVRPILLFYSVGNVVAVIIATVIGYFALQLAYSWGLHGKMWRFGVYMALMSVVMFFVLFYK